MNPKWLAGWVMQGIAVGTVAADALDDTGLSEADFALVYRMPDFGMGGFGMAGPRFRSLEGIPISQAHVAGIAGEMGKRGRFGESGFFEGVGNYEKALDGLIFAPLDRVRLLLRAGRMEEARAALDAEGIAKLADSLNPESVLQLACRPLEDAADWDRLQAFLDLLSSRMTSPEWRVALWAEELDIAWHLDRVPALLEKAAGDPLRLAVFQHRLGNLEERDRLAGELLQNATPARVAEIFAMLSECPPVREAAMVLWNRPELAADDRKALYSRMIRLDGTTAADVFQTWLKNGGDAVPLADLIWRRGLPRTSVPAVLATALQARHPDEPGFRLILGRELMKSDPARAAELFESVATTLPLMSAGTTRQAVSPDSWTIRDLAYLPEMTFADLAYVAIRGLGLLDRQDRIRAVLDKRAADWAALPAVDRVRYLAAGEMDFELVKTALEADFSKPENDSLARWLSTFLQGRSESRAIPKEILARTSQTFAALVAGSSEKEANQSSSDAASLLRLPGSGEIDSGIWKDQTGKLTAILHERDPEKSGNLAANLRSLASAQPWAAALLPDGEEPEGDKSISINRQMQSWGLINLFSPPKIRRIGPAGNFDRFRMGNPMGMSMPGSGPLPLNALTRWSGALGENGRGIAWMGRPPKKEEQAALRALMREFPAGSSQRLLADILVANGILSCGDDALETEAKASFAALMAGEKEPRGTELFRYLTLVGKRAPQAELQKVLAEVKSQPPAAREEFFRQISSQRIPAGIHLVRRELGIPDPARGPGKPDNQPDADAVKLRDLLARNLTASPEAIELAKRVLDRAASGEIDRLQDATFAASNVLQTTGMLDGWLREERDKLEKSGLPKLEILRRLKAIDRRQPSDGTSPQADYAREIFALDPTDREAARQVLEIALGEGNRDLLLACARTLGAEAILRLSPGDVLTIFGAHHEAEIFQIIRGQGVDPAMTGSDTIANLHRFFLAGDPGVAADFREWISSRGDSLDRNRYVLAGQLLDAGRRDEAVDLIARAFVTPLEYPGFPFQFPPKPGTGHHESWERFDISKMEADLKFLRERDLFGPVVARIGALGGGDPLAVASFGLAASPDAATFERLAAPILGKMGEPYRGATINQWRELFEKQPGMGEVLAKLLEESTKEVERPYQTAERIRQAAPLPNGSMSIAKLWDRLSDAAAKADDSSKKEAAETAMRSVTREMITSADDATWDRFWKWRVADGAPLENLGYFPYIGDGASYVSLPTGFVKPERLREVLRELLARSGGKLPQARLETWTYMAVATGDRELIGKVKSGLPDGDRAGRELCDLALGDTAAISPVFGAVPADNGETLLWWNLVSVPAAKNEHNSYDIPRSPFPALDGKCDLQIAAGNEPDRLKIIRKLPAAPSAGHLRLKLEPGQRYLAMVATDPATGEIRWTQPLETDVGSGPLASLSDEQWQAKGFQRLAENGPGGLPAWKIQFSGRDEVDLLEREWTGSDSVSINAWVTGDDELKLRCLDAAGRELKAFDLYVWDSYLPAWQLRSFPGPDERDPIPAETAKLVLSASVYGFDPGTGETGISALRMDLHPSAAPPEKTDRIARLPAAASSLALSPDGSKIAAGLADGSIYLVDLAAGTTKEIPVPPSPQPRELRVNRIAWNAAGVHILLSDGYLYRVDEATAELRPLMRIVNPRIGGGGNFQMTDDGKWIVWTDSTGIVLASADGGTRRTLERARNFSLTDGVLHFMDNNGLRFTLKTADFAKGEPATDDEPAARPDQPEMHPKWRNRLQFDYRGRASDGKYINIPAARESIAMKPDGTIYYVDPGGSLLRLEP